MMIEKEKWKRRRALKRDRTLTCRSYLLTLSLIPARGMLRHQRLR
jgi:hypothetical protein